MDDGTVRLWSLTEEDSGPDLSAPETVQFLRDHLSEDRPFTWAELVEQGKHLGFPVESLSPQDPSPAFRVLAALWARHVFPGRAAKRYLDFGQVMEECTLGVGPGKHNAKQHRAYDSARLLFEDLRSSNWSMRSRISEVCMKVASAIL